MNRVGVIPASTAGTQPASSKCLPVDNAYRKENSFITILAMAFMPDSLCAFAIRQMRRC